MTGPALRRAAAVVGAALVLALVPAPAHSVSSGPVTTITGSAGSLTDARVQMSADGARATAVWVATIGDDQRIQSASATITAARASWGSVTTLSAAGSDASQPQVALSADGSRATVVWKRSTAAVTFGVIESASAAIAGQSADWGAVTPVSDNAGIFNVASDPQVDLSSDGSKALVVWRLNDGVDDVIQSNVATVVGTVATWETVKAVTAAGGEALSPRASISANGVRGTVVWARSAGVDPRHQIQVRAGGTSAGGWVWGGASALSDASQDAETPQLALSDAGDAATVVWTRSNGTHDIVQAHSLVIQGPLVLRSGTQDLSAPGQHARDPLVAASASGAAVVAIWRRSDGVSPVVQSRPATVDAGAATWGAVQDVVGSAPAVSAPDVAVSADGSLATAVWSNTGDANLNAIGLATARVAGATASWDAAQRLSEVGTDANGPDLALSSDGRVSVSVWHSPVPSPVIQSAVTAQTQTIDFPAPAATAVTGGPVALTATASSGLAVNYTSTTPAVCAVSGASATLTAVGTCSIVAAQAGDLTYAPAASVERSFEVTAEPLQVLATSLTVSARKATKKLKLRTRTAVVREVTTDGSVTERKAACYRKGKKAKRACTVTRKADGRILITPKCTRKVRARVRITAAAPGAAPTTWSRTWKVAKRPPKAC